MTADQRQVATNTNVPSNLTTPDPSAAARDVNHFILNLIQDLEKIRSTCIPYASSDDAA